MHKSELLSIIAGQEDSKVEFKRDGCRPVDLAKEMAALLNLEGGTVLLGVEDDGQISGLKRGRKDVEEWVMNIAQTNVQPSFIPTWSCIEIEDTQVGVIQLPPDSPGKPYKAKLRGLWVTYSRVGSTSRVASREEETRLYQESRNLNYEVTGVQRTDLNSLDLDLVESYLRAVLRREAPTRTDIESWLQLLLNSDILVKSNGAVRTSVAGNLLFGVNPNRGLPQAGVTAVAFPGLEKDYNTTDEEIIRGPLVPHLNQDRKVLEPGLIDRTIEFVRRNMGSSAWLDGARRQRKGVFAIEAIREAITNAFVHRDYSLATDIEVSLFQDRLEIISPGRLPNGVTIEKMKEGVVRVARNGLLKEILRDYGYVEHFGMGVRNRIIRMTIQHNNTIPDLEEQDDRFLVRLWKAPSI